MKRASSIKRSPKVENLQKNTTTTTLPEMVEAEEMEELIEQLHFEWIAQDAAIELKMDQVARLKADTRK